MRPSSIRRSPGITSSTPAVTVGYSAVGGHAGITAFSAKQADFGASDVPMTAAEQAAARGGQVVQVPVALGAEGVVYNLSLPAGSRLHLTGPVLARIFLGQITSWHDPAITALNPGPQSPGRADLCCAPLRRQRHHLHLQQLPVQRLPAPGRPRSAPARRSTERPGEESRRQRRGSRLGVPHAPSPSDTSSSPIGKRPAPAVRRPPQPGRATTSSRPLQSISRGRSPEARHHARQLLDRQRTRDGRLPHQRVQLGARLCPSAKPGRRAASRQPPGLARPRHPRSYAAATSYVILPSRIQAARPLHAPAGHRAERDTLPGVNAAGHRAGHQP